MPTFLGPLIYLAWFGIAFVFASLVEYWVHRLMHIDPRFGKVHIQHHKENTGQGFWLEFRNYVVGTAPMMATMFLFSWQIGLSCTLGGLSYAAFAAYAHQLQHDNPVRCDWMEMPVHYVHHKYDQWHHNFGLAVDWWDHVFGTYQPKDWLSATELEQPRQGYFQIKWW
ncbi:MAG: sterol desaturase family protein [Cyanobacteria bacterium P01_D01_bin.36]